MKEFEEKSIHFSDEFQTIQLYLSNKLKVLDKKKQVLKTLMKLFENLDKILNFFIEQKIAVSKDPSFIENLALYLSILLIISFKHPSKYRVSLVQSLTKVIDFGIDPSRNPLYEILFDQGFVYEKMEYDIPTNKLFLESLSAIEFLLEYNVFFLRVIDTSGLCKRFLLEKYKKNSWVESWTKNKDSDGNIERILTSGGLLIIEEWDEELMKIIEPILEWKIRMINKEISRFFLKKKEGSQRPSSFIGENIVVFKGKEVMIHAKFKLCLVLRKNSKDFFRDLKLKVKKNGGNWENSLIFEGFDG